MTQPDKSDGSAGVSCGSPPFLTFRAHVWSGQFRPKRNEGDNPRVVRHKTPREKAGWRQCPRLGRQPFLVAHLRLVSPRARDDGPTKHSHGVPADVRPEDRLDHGGLRDVPHVHAFVLCRIVHQRRGGGRGGGVQTFFWPGKVEKEKSSCRRLHNFGCCLPGESVVKEKASIFREVVVGWLKVSRYRQHSFPLSSVGGNQRQAVLPLLLGARGIFRSSMTRNLAHS